MLLHRHLIGLTLLFVAAPQLASATNHILYECTDAEGGRQFTNIPPKPKSTNCRVISVGPATTAPAPAAPAGAPVPKASGAAKAAPQPSPANFPRVDRETQQSRDSQRRRILEQELGGEQKLLEQAKKDLSEQESVRLGSERNYQKVLDRLEPYQRKVKQHEDNIANLKKELSNLR